MVVTKEIDNILQKFDTVSLKELGDYKLLNRIDTKYICNINQLPVILQKAVPYFKIQAKNDDRIFRYESLYYDTPDLKTYFDHHMGKRLRYKIRFRRYLDTGDTFLEVKKKLNYTRTDKKRVQTQLSDFIGLEHENFIKKHIHYPKEGLIPNIWTIYERITLAGKKHLERITIDIGIQFKGEGVEKDLPEVVVVEVKRSKNGKASPFTQILKEEGLRPCSMSKYVMGNILIKPGIKKNRFKKRIITINKIRHGIT